MVVTNCCLFLAFDKEPAQIVPNKKFSKSLLFCNSNFLSTRYRFSVATLNKSKTLDGPQKNPQKTPGQISMRFPYILGENSTFPGENPTFSEKSRFSPPKFLMTFFS